MINNKYKMTNIIVLVLALLFITLGVVLAYLGNVQVSKIIMFYSSIFTLLLTSMQSWLQIDYHFFKQDSLSTNRRIIISIVIAISLTVLLYVLDITGVISDFSSELQEFSNRGGMWAISLSLLLLNLLSEQWNAEAEDYKIEKEKEKEILQENNELKQKLSKFQNERIVQLNNQKKELNKRYKE